MEPKTTKTGCRENMANISMDTISSTLTSVPLTTNENERQFWLGACFGSSVVMLIYWIATSELMHAFMEGFKNG
jgi:hypothetical protein